MRLDNRPIRSPKTHGGGATAAQARVRKSPVSRTAPLHVRESASSAAPTLKSTSDQAV